MNILVVSATRFEIKPFTEKLTLSDPGTRHLVQYRLTEQRIDVLVPGIGMMNTAYHMGRQLSMKHYDAAINAGFAGSFRPEIKIGDVVEVTEDSVTEFRAEENGKLVPFFDLGLTDPDEPPYRKGRLINDKPVRVPSLDPIKKVKGSTVNTLFSSSRRTILPNPPHADIESMEGAAFLYACLSAGIPNLQLRSISNYVGERDKTKWDLNEAAKSLNKVLAEVVNQLMSG